MIIGSDEYGGIARQDNMSEVHMTRDWPEIITPQFHRGPYDPISGAPPGSNLSWDDLRALSCQALKEIGLRPWNDPAKALPGDAVFEGKQLMLFPGEWYRHIPDGYEVVSINGKREAFHAMPGRDDIRFGCLAYGILVSP